MLLDIHAHLYWDTFAPDLDGVLESARAAGIAGAVVVGCDVAESRQAVALAEKYQSIWASVGCHPHEFTNVAQYTQKYAGTNWIEDLRTLAQSPRVVAIGECGLDYYIRPTSGSTASTIVGRHTTSMSDEQKLLQRENFEKQLVLASELQKPIIIHCREAYDDMFAILQKYNTTIPSIVLHCYMGSVSDTQNFLTLTNMYFSFTANITYPVKKSLVGTNDDLTEVVKVVPIERIFVETDAPFLAPQEVRGSRNEPKYAMITLRTIAALQNISEFKLQTQIEKNIETVFGIK